MVHCKKKEFCNHHVAFQLSFWHLEYVELTVFTMHVVCIEIKRARLVKDNNCKSSTSVGQAQAMEWKGSFWFLSLWIILNVWFYATQRSSRSLELIMCWFHFLLIPQASLNLNDLYLSFVLHTRTWEIHCSHSTSHQELSPQWHLADCRTAVVWGAAATLTFVKILMRSAKCPSVTTEIIITPSD